MDRWLLDVILYVKQKNDHVAIKKKLHMLKISYGTMFENLSWVWSYPQNLSLLFTHTIFYGNTNNIVMHNEKLTLTSIILNFDP